MVTPSRKRIVLIGPFLPFRGGIAQHTTMLYRAMRELVDVRAISFSKQYPAWLFPGASDRDPAYEGYREDGVEYILNSLNPLSWSRALRKCKEYMPVRVVIPWWTVYWAPCFWYLARGFRRSGIRVVYFCHNVVEHESSFWKRWLTKRVLREGEEFVVHTRVDKENLLAFLPQADVRIQAHPIYAQFPRPKGVLPRRAKLELLFFGFVRPYKGLDNLIEALGMVKGADVFLTIAGEFWEGEASARKRIDELGLSDKVEIVPNYLTDDQVAEHFSRADIVVLPYRSATGSGVVPLAYHYCKPVIVTEVGGLPDVVEDGRTGFVVPRDRPRELAAAIEKMTPEVIATMKTAIESKKQELTWEALAEAVTSGI